MLHNVVGGEWGRWGQGGAGMRIGAHRFESCGVSEAALRGKGVSIRSKFP